MFFTTKKSYRAQSIDTNVWKITAGSNIYIIFIGNEPIVIDAGDRKFRKEAQFVESVTDPRNVKKVIFTHLHYDHIGNFDLFPNAEFFASEEEIESLEKDREGTIADKEMAAKFSAALKPASMLNVPCLEIIKTPGHTKGSICIYHREKQILFSGDTIFKNKIVGRTDLPSSLPEEMPKTLIKLLNWKFRILCPGHDY